MNTREPNRLVDPLTHGTGSPPEPSRHKPCGDWFLVILLTGIPGMFVFGIWGWDTWKTFALVFWAIGGLIAFISLLANA